MNWGLILPQARACKLVTGRSSPITGTHWHFHSYFLENEVLPLVPIGSFHAQNERSIPRLFFEHRNVTCWHSRCYMIMELFAQCCFVMYKCIKARFKHLRALGQDLVDFGRFGRPQLTLLTCPARVVVPQRRAQDSPSSHSVQFLRLNCRIDYKCFQV